jgi:uncharacterized protein
MAVGTKDPAVLEKVEGHKPNLDNSLVILQGKDHEIILVRQLRKNLGPGELIELEDFSPVEKTRESLAMKPKAITQAGLEKSYGDVVFGGYADLLIRDDFEPGMATDGTFDLVPSGKEFTGYTVWDIKHSSGAKPEHLHQVGGYLEGLQELGAVSRHGKSGIVLRSKEAASFSTSDLVSGFLEASAGIFEFLNQNPPASFKLPSDFVFECPTKKICKDYYCEYPSLCTQERYVRDDLSQLYDLNKAHPGSLRDAGFDTVTKLANADPNGEIGKINPVQFHKHHNWAKVITKARASGKHELALLVPPEEFANLLPTKTPGDLFVDFEWYQPTGESTEHIYILGVTDWDENFEPFLSETRDKEHAAFHAFVKFALDKLAEYPDAHLYHFHNPEFKKLTDLSKRYGELADEVARIQERMFDILPIVTNRMVNSLAGLGIKQLGKFFLSDHGPSSPEEDEESVEDGLDSMVFFFKYLKAVEAGDPAKAAVIMNNILEYNKADCTATSRLYTWLYDGNFK